MYVVIEILNGTFLDSDLLELLRLQPCCLCHKSASSDNASNPIVASSKPFVYKKSRSGTSYVIGLFMVPDI